MSYIDLHVHSTYSYQDAQGTPEQIVLRAVSLGRNTIALTDHGSVSGLVQFEKACRGQGVNPIFGAELYVIPNLAEIKERGHKKYHITVLAKNLVGYRNLMKLVTLSYNNFYYKPTVDLELLDRHKEGLIILSGCMFGMVGQTILHDEKNIDAVIQNLHSVFGNNFYLEVQHFELPEVEAITRYVFEHWGRYGIKPVLTSDVHYQNINDKGIRECMHSVRKYKKGEDKEDRKDVILAQLSDDELRQKMLDRGFAASDIEMAMATTIEIASQCDMEIPTVDTPRFVAKGGVDSGEYLRQKSYEGLARRGLSNEPEYIARLDRELEIIISKGFADYMLIVGDLVIWAKKNGILVGAGRGSSAGSLIAYCLYTTEVDPLKYGLLFERFIDHTRMDFPDIDLDFDDQKRALVKNYLLEKYGNVCDIATFMQYQVRSAVDDIVRVYELPDAVANDFKFLFEKEIHEGNDPYANSKIQDYVNNYPQLRYIDGMLKQVRGSSKHAAGVVLSNFPIDDVCAIVRPGGKEPITAWEYDDLACKGFLKIDVLGLKTLNVIDDVLTTIGKDQTWLYSLPLDDPKVYDTLCDGKLAGIFQLEGDAAQMVTKRLKPKSIEQIAAINALSRPGTLDAKTTERYILRKNGEEDVLSIHPLYDEITKDTYGTCVVGDTQVQLMSGRHERIDKLVKDNAIGTKILSVDGDGKLTEGRITHCFDNGEKPVYELVLKGGSKIEATADHKILTYDGWKELSSLQNTDLVAVPKRILKDQVTQYSEDQLIVLAYLLADGHIAAKTNVSFVSKNRGLIESFKRRVLGGFENVRFSEHVGVRNVITCGVVSQKRDCYQSNRLLNYLDELGLRRKKSADKHIPDFIYELDEGLVCKFLAAYWDCDGHVAKKFAHIKTISGDIAFGIQSLLLQVGIRTSVYISQYCNRHGKQKAYQVTVFNMDKFKEKIMPFLITDKKDIQVIAVVDNSFFLRYVLKTKVEDYVANSGISLRQFKKITKNGLKWFYGSYSFVKIKTVKAVNLALRDEEIDKLISSDICYLPILSIRYAGEKSVYDIQVDNDHSFVANHIVVHNCIYQEQFMRICRELGNMEWKDVGVLRKSINKKMGADFFNTYRERFVKGAVENGMDEKQANSLWDTLLAIGSYIFNLSHAISYSLLGYYTAYLKTYYPLEFYKANLARDDSFKVMKEYRAQYKNILPLDLNRSKESWIIDDGALRIGFTQIKGIGEKAAQAVVAKQPYQDWEDFENRVIKRTCNSKHRTLIKDMLGKNSMVDVERLSENVVGLPITKLSDIDVDGFYLLAGFIKEKNVRTTDKGGRVVVLVEDESAQVELMVSNIAFQQLSPIVMSAKPTDLFLFSCRKLSKYAKIFISNVRNLTESPLLTTEDDLEMLKDMFLKHSSDMVAYGILCEMVDKKFNSELLVHDVMTGREFSVKCNNAKINQQMRSMIGERVMLRLGANSMAQNVIPVFLFKQQKGYCDRARQTLSQFEFLTLDGFRQYGQTGKGVGLLYGSSGDATWFVDAHSPVCIKGSVGADFFRNTPVAVVKRGNMVEVASLIEVERQKYGVSARCERCFARIGTCNCGGGNDI